MISKGWPVLFVHRQKENGSMMMTMHMAAVLVPAGPLSRKKSGTPRSAPPPKQMSCLLVRLTHDLGLTL